MERPVMVEAERGAVVKAEVMVVLKAAAEMAGAETVVALGVRVADMVAQMEAQMAWAAMARE